MIQLVPHLVDVQAACLDEVVLPPGLCRGEPQAPILLHGVQADLLADQAMLSQMLLVLLWRKCLQSHKPCKPKKVTSLGWPFHHTLQRFARGFALVLQAFFKTQDSSPMSIMAVEAW